MRGDSTHAVYYAAARKGCKGVGRELRCQRMLSSGLLLKVLP